MSVASVALIFGFMEIWVRLFFRNEIDAGVLRAGAERVSIRSVVQPSTDPKLYFELKPSLDLSFQGQRTITSSGQYRIGVSEAPGVSSSTHGTEAPVRIAVLGDSTPFGWGVTYEESYPELYRRMMSEKTARPVELRNYSVPGYNAIQETRLFELRVKDYRPDLLILHHDHNDADPTAKYRAAFIAPEYGNNLLHSAVVKFVLRRVRRKTIETALKSESKGQGLLGEYIATGPPYDAHLSARRALANQARSIGSPVVAVIFNAYVERDEDYTRSDVYRVLHKPLAARLAAMGYRPLDLFPIVQALLAQRGWLDLRAWSLTRDDRHPNAAGHRFIAEQLATFTLADPVLLAIFKKVRVSTGVPTTTQRRPRTDDGARGHSGGSAQRVRHWAAPAEQLWLSDVLVTLE